MGTKAHPATAINLLAKCKFARAFNSEFNESILMDRALEQQRIMEAIKTTMLRHEEDFKHQVRELHRVYSVQRMLMNELQREVKQQGIYSDTTRLLPSSSTTTTNQSNLCYSFHIQKEKVQRITSVSSLEQKNSSSVRTTRAAKGLIDLECPAQQPGPPDADEAAVGPSGRMMHEGTNDEDCSGVDLTLSIGCGASKKGGLGCSMEPMISCTREIGFGGSSSSPASFKSDKDCTSSNTTTTTLHQGRSEKRPHWPFHGLKLG